MTGIGFSRFPVEDWRFRENPIGNRIRERSALGGSYLAGVSTKVPASPSIAGMAGTVSKSTHHTGMRPLLGPATMEERNLGVDNVIRCPTYTV